MAMTITPSSAPLGAEIRGIDLSTPLSDGEFRQLKQALDDYSVLSVREQKLTSPQQVAFAAQYGPLQGYNTNGLFRVPEAPDLIIISNILEKGVPIGSVEAGQHWHTDIPYTAKPPAYVFLYGIEVPKDDKGNVLGATMAISQGHAYETLPEDIKKKLEGKRALHRRDRLKLSNTRKKFGTDFDSDDLSFIHPVIRTHPATGRKGLYVNATYTEKILDMDETESTELLGYLCQHATREDVRYIHRWEVGDLLIWDDCAIQHHAVADYQLPQRRRMHRATVAGMQPF